MTNPKISTVAAPIVAGGLIMAIKSSGLSSGMQAALFSAVILLLTVWLLRALKQWLDD